MGTIDQDRRRQRKKEIKKNKEKRIAQRDEKVKQTKTSKQINQEIRDFEKRHKHQLGRHEIKSKLDRLKKELKIVQGHEEQQKKQQSEAKHYQPGIYAAKSSFVQLDRPEMSVYYDPQYNPYGAPPPGKPMLFHRYGGGVTMNIQEAVVPGEQLPVQASITPIGQRQPQSQAISQPRSPDADTQKSKPRNPIQSQRQTQEPPPPPPPPPLSPQQRQQQPDNVPPPPVIRKEDIPNLPSPSESVRRTQRKRRNLAADIWASNEEVEYERAVYHVDLEDASAAKRVEEEKDEWCYLDTSNQMQGPFSTEHMNSWHSLGYFPPSTKVKRIGKHADFVELRSLGGRAFAAPPLRSKSRKSKEQVRKEEEESAVQARIAALKQRKQPDHRNQTPSPIIQDTGALVEETIPDKEDDPVQARIAALKQSSLQDHQQINADNADDDVNDSAQDRIAALRADHQTSRETEQSAEAIVHDGEMLSHVAQPATVRAGTDPDKETGDKNDQASYGDDSHIVAAYPVDSEAGDATALYPGAGDKEIPAYPVDDDGGTSYPIDDTHGDSYLAASACYPVDDGDCPDDSYPAVAPYPTDENGDDAYPAVAPYPTKDDAAYPVFDVYPAGEYPVGEGEHPVGEYPVADESNNDDAGQPTMKKMKVDKALVSLLPSHLQKRNLGKK